MFAARAMAVFVSVFVIVYCTISLAVCLGWRRMTRSAKRYPAAPAADLLFRVRMLPVLAALAVTGVFAVPSFLLLEPRAIDEPLGSTPLLLTFLGVALAISGSVQAALALLRSSRAISAWKHGARPVDTGASAPAFEVTTGAPAMTAAGIVRPAILLSATARALLSPNELRIAVRHEVVHVQRHDNLRKLLLRCVAFPGMAKLEAAWVEATEIAADHAAVSSISDALDLAAALIKLSRAHPQCPPADLTAALVQSPAAVMNARVERLLAWSKADDRQEHQRSGRFGYFAAIGALALVATSYTQLLLAVHSVTEWLVR